MFSDVRVRCERPPAADLGQKGFQASNASVTLWSLLCLLTILVTTSIILTGCSRGSNPIALFEGQWISDIPFTYSIGNSEYTIPHDNRIYESANFLIFSDASGDGVKKTIAIIAETKLQELKQAFDIPSSEELGITGRSTKIMIYANRNMLSRDTQYFPCGIILYSLDSRYWVDVDPATDPPILDIESFPRFFKHELMHVFQHLLGLGLDGYDDWPEVWFSEGIAEYVSGGTFFYFATMTDVNSWLAQADHVNPISIGSFQDYPVPLERVGEYYPMFHLAVRYLLSEEGNGKNLNDAKKLYEALRNGDTFADAFETNMGVSPDYFEENFYDLLSQFLQ
ncbi:MAG: hypothetical protein JSU74_14455 [Candidatus Zixiibacteriota bacterium]|nr:MAG: hypothetical protein JSU74_14455 [candidate division Zixibacteria bacterium]